MMNVCFYRAIDVLPLGTVAAIEFLPMLIAGAVALPIGFHEAAPAFADPALLAAAVVVGICSSVVPYVADQLVMRRIARATYSLMTSLLPATATVIGIIVLSQIPTSVEVVAVVLVIAGVALHHEPAQAGAGTAP